jgi:hypothetical protein
MIEDAHEFPVTCDLCGEKALGTIETSAASWRKSTVIEHRDTRVCANNLKRKLDKANKALEEARTYMKSCAETMEMVEGALKKAREAN